MFLLLEQHESLPPPPKKEENISETIQFKAHMMMQLHKCSSITNWYGRLVDTRTFGKYMDTSSNACAITTSNSTRTSCGSQKKVNNYHFFLYTIPLSIIKYFQKI